MAPPLLTRQQFAKIRPQGNYQSYVNYVTQTRARRNAVAPGSTGGWVDPPQVRGKVGPNVVMTGEGLFSPEDVPGVDPNPAVDPTGLDPTNPGAPAPGAGVIPPPATRHVAAHWFTPDWESMIKGDARFIAGQSALSANKATAATKRAQAIKNAIIHFGGIPKDWASGYGDINQADIASAQENPYSTMALANAARGRGNADLMAELAGRGILSSGALTGGQNMVQKAYESGLNTDTNTLLGVLGGAESTFGSDIQGLDTDWLNTQAQIGAGIQGANPAQWIPDYEEPI